MCGEREGWGGERGGIKEVQQYIIIPEAISITGNSFSADYIQSKFKVDLTRHIT